MPQCGMAIPTANQQRIMAHLAWAYKREINTVVGAMREPKGGV
jgi:hypothetical protein